MNKRHGASAVSPRFYFTTLLVLVIIIFLCTPGGRKSFRQAGLTNGNALVHGYWFAPIGWPVDYDIDTVQRGVYRWFKIQTKSWGWNDPGDWVGWNKLVCQAFSSRSSPASPTSPTSPTSPKADPGQWCSIPSLQWVILVPGATKRWLICSTRHLRSWS